MDSTSNSISESTSDSISESTSDSVTEPDISACAQLPRCADICKKDGPFNCECSFENSTGCVSTTCGLCLTETRILESCLYKCFSACGDCKTSTCIKRFNSCSKKCIKKVVVCDTLDTLCFDDHEPDNTVSQACQFAPLNLVNCVHEARAEANDVDYILVKLDVPATILVSFNSTCRIEASLLAADGKVIDSDESAVSPIALSAECSEMTRFYVLIKNPSEVCECDCVPYTLSIAELV